MAREARGLAIALVLFYGSAMLDLVRVYLLVFGLLSVAGGVVGFVKARSKASLIAGGGAGALLVVSGVLLGTANARAGLILGVVVSVALAARFVPGFLKTRKPMPAGMMAALSVVGAALTLLALVRG